MKKNIFINIICININFININIIINYKLHLFNIYKIKLK